MNNRIIQEMIAALESAESEMISNSWDIPETQYTDSHEQEFGEWDICRYEAYQKVRQALFNAKLIRWRHDPVYNSRWGLAGL